MSTGMLVLTVVAVLVFFGVAQRVLDRMRLTDRQALLLVAAMFVGTLLPNVGTGPGIAELGRRGDSAGGMHLSSFHLWRRKRSGPDAGGYGIDGGRRLCPICIFTG